MAGHVPFFFVVFYFSLKQEQTSNGFVNVAIGMIQENSEWPCDAHKLSARGGLRSSKRANSNGVGLEGQFFLNLKSLIPSPVNPRKQSWHNRV